MGWSRRWRRRLRIWGTELKPWPEMSTVSSLHIHKHIVSSECFHSLRFGYLCYMTHVFMIIMTPEMPRAHLYNSRLEVRRI